tara:strand:- start:404 stop:682 length:279 start_codon:yes stop_codon:yes gene_type:complete
MVVSKKKQQLMARRKKRQLKYLEEQNQLSTLTPIINNTKSKIINNSEVLNSLPLNIEDTQYIQEYIVISKDDIDDNYSQENKKPKKFYQYFL